MVKGDAEKGKMERSKQFDKDYKVGDIAFSPIYGRVRIVKINDKTAVAHQINQNNNPIIYGGSGGRPSQIAIKKYLFKLKGE